ncbi:unnamed protein product [Ceratitis capitata]|uniref:(Mediterranean fruit fly) hypothetical protein n=1 Tax=Ceratitis capitata TaxID=7213 RepID=A0A811UTE7_CERCA|nr:unnamed protein product [Ceratitis capitata]
MMMMIDELRRLASAALNSGVTSAVKAGWGVGGGLVRFRTTQTSTLSQAPSKPNYNSDNDSGMLTSVPSPLAIMRYYFNIIHLPSGRFNAVFGVGGSFIKCNLLNFRNFANGEISLDGCLTLVVGPALMRQRQCSGSGKQHTLSERHKQI